MNDEEISKFPSFLIEQLSRIKQEGVFYPTSNAEHYEYKTYFVNEFSKNKEPTYVNLSDLDQVKFVHYIASKVHTITLHTNTCNHAGALRS